MSLREWADNGWLRPHRTTPEEVANLLAIVQRDLADAARDISADWRFGIAYNAALKLCSILLRAEGYRAERNLQHYRTIQAVGLILPDWEDADTTYLDACRKKRNTAEYDLAGSVTHTEAEELVAFMSQLRDRVLTWLRTTHPELLG